MILTLTMDGSEGVGLAVNRLNAMPGRKGTAGFCFLQSEEMFRTFCGARCKGTEYGRSEWGIRALVSYLHPALYRKNADGRTITVPSTDEYRRWFRRGRDPYKLRKMFPRAILSSCSGTVEAAAGRELFDMTVDLLVAKITRFINQQQQTEAVECPERIKTGKRKRDVSEFK